MGGKERWIAITVEEATWEKRVLEEKIEAIRNNLEHAGNETLVYRNDRGNYRYYSQTCVDKTRKRVYLADQDEIVELFSVKLQRSWLKDYEKKLDAVKAYLRKDDGTDSTRTLLKNEAWRNVLLMGYDKWQNADYERNTAFPEGLILSGREWT